MVKPTSHTAAETLPIEIIAERILLIRGHKVLLDSDLAELYGVSTKRLNEQIKRNPDRFPGDFMFQLTAREKAEVVAKCDHLRRLKYASTRPYAFTEHGALMAASVLNTPRAVEISVYVVRAFVRLRQLLAGNQEMAAKLKELESRLDIHDSAIAELIEAIRLLMVSPQAEDKRSIGFAPWPEDR